MKARFPRWKAKRTIRLKPDAACATPSGSNKQTLVKQTADRPLLEHSLQVLVIRIGEKMWNLATN
jgi:hypothetical protein